MIDIENLARESGVEKTIIANFDWWVFSPDELQLFTAMMWQAAQAAEKERILKSLDSALMLRGGIPSEALLLARAAIAKYEGESNGIP